MSVPCIRLLGSVFIGIEIAIGIEIDAVDSLILSNKAINVQFFVPKRHVASIPIAIPIWIWMIPTGDYDFTA
jgi:hypothetical protein